MECAFEGASAVTARVAPPDLRVGSGWPLPRPVWSVVHRQALDALVVGAGRPYWGAGAMTEPVNELDFPVFTKLSPQPCVRDGVKELFLVINGDRRPFDLLVLAVNDDDRRLSDFQPQPVRSVGVNEIK